MYFDIEAAAVSDIGARKKVNQDACLIRQTHDGLSLFAVADGVGGLEHGEVASNTAVNMLCDLWSSALLPYRGEEIDYCALLADCARKCNKRLMELPYRTATTLSVLLIVDLRYYIAHIGDSRIYLKSGRKLKQLTEDHTEYVVRENAGKTTRVGLLSRFLGCNESCDCQLMTGECRQGDHYLICSDGVYKTADDAAILKTMKGARALEGGCRALIDSAIGAGETDNITAVIVEIGAKQK